MKHWLDEHLFHAEPDPDRPAVLHRHPAAQRHRRRCTWATRSTTPSRTCSRGTTACWARTPAGWSAPTTPASPRRTWSRRCCAPRASPRRTWAARSSSSACWEWREEYGGTIIEQLKRLGCCLRLRARALHDRRGLRARRAPRSSSPSTRRATSTRTATSSTGARAAGRRSATSRSRTRTCPARCNHIRYEVAGRRQRHHRHHASGDDARRHGRGGAPRRRALHGPRRQDGRAAAAGARAPDRRRRARRPRVRHRRAQDHAGARPHRLRDRPHARAASPSRPSARTAASPRPAARTPGSRSRRPPSASSRTCASSARSSRSRTTRTASATCDRCGTAIEPLISEQWFMDMDAAQDAGHGRGARRQGQVHAGALGPRLPRLDGEPARLVHQPPALVGAPAAGVVLRRTAHIIVAETEPHACAECGGTELTRETDVLDTWFSSALWPFATLGWPEQTADLAYFYPTNVLTTAREIIFLWVARMVMMGLEFMDDVPFDDVYIHSVIQAPDGRRMSKSLGTGIDPLELIDKYGADATRFGLLLMSSTQDVRFSEEKIAMGRDFANKLWNASRFVLLASEGYEAERSDADQVDRWITSRFQRCLATVETAVDGYDFSAAVDTLYHFVWNEFCDWYLELVKVRLYGEDEAAEGRGRGARALAARADRAPAAPVPAVRHRGDRGAVRRDAADRPGASAPRRRRCWRPTTRRRSATLQAAVDALRQFRAETKVPPGQVLSAVFVGDGAAAVARYTPYVRRLPGAGAHRGGSRWRAAGGLDRRARARRPPRGGRHRRQGRGDRASRAAAGQGRRRGRARRGEARQRGLREPRPRGRGAEGAR